MKIINIISSVVMFLFMALTGCGANKSDPVNPTSAQVISFTASGSPSTNSVYLEKVSTNNDEITLAIKVKEGTDVYGAAPTITYDGSKINFVSASASGSYLGNDLAFFAVKLNDQEGTLIIGIDKKGTSAGTGGDGTLLTIVLKATSTQSNTAIEFNTTNSLLYNSQPKSNNTISNTTWLGGSLSY
ncbi:MAG: cohesin domain-containing protein [bacterium]|nr:cohesin domain-containing protein [bacterium]